MTAAPAAVIPAAAARERRAPRRPVVIEVDQAKLVEQFNALDTFVTDAVDANGAALYVAHGHLAVGPERDAIREALVFSHEALKKAVEAARTYAGLYDWKPPKAN